MPYYRETGHGQFLLASLSQGAVFGFAGVLEYISENHMIFLYKILQNMT